MSLPSADDEAADEAALRGAYEALVRAYQTRVVDLETNARELHRRHAALRNEMDALVDGYRELESAFFERHESLIGRIRHEISALESTDRSRR